MATLKRVLAVTLAGLFAVTLSAGAATGTSAGGTSTEARPDFTAQARQAGLTATQAEDLQARVDSEIAARGGTQIAANEILWKEGGASTVLALPGQKKPVSLRHGAGIQVPACTYLHMCLYSDWGTGGSVMYDLFYCRDYHTPGYWLSYHNNQTRGTRAAFKNSGRAIIDWSQAAPSWANYDSGSVFYVKPC
jgi:hypothetical protein